MHNSVLVTGGVITLLSYFAPLPVFANPSVPTCHLPYCIFPLIIINLKKKDIRVWHKSASPLVHETEPYVPSPILFTYGCAVPRSFTGYFNFHYRRYFKTPPLCFAMQNIGEVSRSDGGIGKYRQ